VDVDKNNTNFSFKVSLKNNQKLNMYIYMVASSCMKKLDVSIKHKSNSNSNVFVRTFVNNKANVNICLDAQAEKNNTNVVANQFIDGLIFDNRSKINVLPSLVVDTNSIKANHSVNIGNVNPEDLFYIMSKGVNKKQATLLLLQSMISDLKQEQDKKIYKLYKKVHNLLNEVVSE
jgi:Fe-S cluster assembly protein SufD